jgi:hypothetical protein
MKQIVFILSFLFISQLAVALPSSSKVLEGAWKEVARTQSGKEIAFSDTLFFEVLSSNLCIWGKSSPDAPRLRFKQIGTTILVGPSEFEIVAQEVDWMKLSSDEGVEIEMKKYNNPKPSATSKSKKEPKRSLPILKLGNVPENIEPMVGNWKCYKRTCLKPISKEQQYRIIRLVEIEETEDYISAKIYGFTDLTAQPSWIVQRYEKGILYSSGKDERDFKVINSQPNELVIENEGVVYYMNKL